MDPFASEERPTDLHIPGKDYHYTWCADDPLRPPMNLMFFYRRIVVRGDKNFTQEVDDPIPK